MIVLTFVIPSSSLHIHYIYGLTFRDKSQPDKITMSTIKSNTYETN